ncbi:ABC transporter permease [Sulfurospirillum arcachonense]|uniref:ABC transporter permease n=1 Tax=Sulfurospirillum arcachonense TaxID=57666 RepID=UPI0004693B45|nr:FtsX-like permease family protein [Sulfurospirillum arcachonense]
MKINHYLIGFAVSSLFRRGTKSLFVLFIFTALIFLLSSILFISNSIKEELNLTLDSLPQIIVQKLQAGRQTNIELKRVNKLLEFQGVQSAVPRIWGYYYFEKAGVNFSLVGIDAYDKQYKNSFANIVKNVNFDALEKTSSMVVGQGVKKALSENYYKNYFNFIKPDGDFIKVPIASTFSSKTSLESNDIILMPRSLVLEIFGMDKTKATDIVLSVANPEEIPTIAKKIKNLYPDTRVITKSDLKVSYQNIFDYKSGMFLALFVISAFTFFMIIYDKASGLSSEEKKEIGILKALGWKIDDILQEKFYEAFIISFVAFISAIILSLFFVYTLEAPILKEIFIGYSRLKPSFDLPFILDVQTIFLLFFLTIPLYLAAIIIPSWRVASMDADEVMR